MDLVFSRTKKISSKSWGKECSLCSSRHGVPIECSATGCKAAYHTTCAIRGKLKMQAIFGKNFKGGIKLRSYCKKHSPTVKLENGIITQSDKIDANGVREIDMTNLADDGIQGRNDELDYFWKYVDVNEVYRNISEAHARAKRLGINHQSDDTSDDEASQKHISKKTKTNIPPTMTTPQKKANIKVEDITPKTTKITTNEVQELDPLVVDIIYRYWMLLRTANNGQSLIKFSPSALKEREEEQRKGILKLRIELERVRNLSYMIGKREKLKAAWLKAHHNIIKRTFNVINDIEPPQDLLDVNSMLNLDGKFQIDAQHNSSHQNQSALINGKKHVPNNGMFDERDQLISDLLTCDQIYDLPPTATSSNHCNLSHQEQSTLERRRTLSLVRRINRQLKTLGGEPSLNPYAKSYLVSKRSDSPTVSANNQAPPLISRTLKFR